jgi:hypothetical protein
MLKTLKQHFSAAMQETVRRRPELREELSNFMVGGLAAPLESESFLEAIPPILKALTSIVYFMLSIFLGALGILWHDMSLRETKSGRPRIRCQFVFRLLLRDDEQEGAIGDFIERHGSKVARLGKRRAQFWAYGEVIRAVWPAAKRAAVRITGAIIKSRIG